MSKRRSARNKRLEQLEAESRMNESHDKMIKLKQIKSSSKATFTRSRHNIKQLLEREEIDKKHIDEERKQLSRQHQKVVEILSELSMEYEQLQQPEQANQTIEEIEKINEQFNEIMDLVSEHFKSLCNDCLSVSSKTSQRSVVKSNKEAELQRKQKELEERHYQEKLELEQEIQNSKSNSVRSKSLVSDKQDDDIERNSAIVGNENDQIQNWLHENERNDHKEKQIGQDLWKQLKRVSIPMFNGDKKVYENWKAAFIACIDKAPATAEYKLLQLRQYLSGEALKCIEGLGHSEYAYEAAKERLERKFGGSRRKVMRHLDDLENFKPIRPGHPRDIEKLADLIEIAVTNLKEDGRFEELGNGTLYHKLQKKLPEEMLARYRRWVYEQSKPENVESLRKFIVLEAEFQVEAAETLHGLQRTPKNREQGNRTHFGSSTRDKEKRDKKICIICKQNHPLWACEKFKSMDVKVRWNVAKENKLCYRCLGRYHRGQDCFRSGVCGIEGCTDTHNRLLHQVAETSKEEITESINTNERLNTSSSEKTNSKTSTENSHTTTLKVQEQRSFVVLRTVPVVINNNGRKMVLNALLDDGSTKTYINNTVAEELGLHGEKQKVEVKVLNGKVESFETMPVKFQLQSVDGKVKINMEAFTTNRVTGDMKVVDWNVIAKKWKHLQEIPFPNRGSKPFVDILIGIDYVQLHRSLQEVANGHDEPIARLTPLGWTCVGNIKGKMFRQHQNNFIHTFTSSAPEAEDINKILTRFWEIEEVPPTEVPVKHEDQRALKVAENSLKFEDGRYEIAIPWKEKKELPNNYKMALSRLANTEKRLMKDPELGQTYGKIIQQYMEKDYLEKVEIDEESEEGWFLPHFPVLRPDKPTTKTRIVFDGAAKFAGVSLNDKILPGPKLQQDLVNVLLRFRRYPVALICDIAEMYLRIGINPGDRQYQRILWRNLDQSIKPEVLQFKRVVFGLNSSPFQAQFVSRKHASNYQEELPSAAETVLKSTYMDDSMDSKEDVPSAIMLYEELSTLWEKAGMYARKWLSNSTEVLQRIPIEDRASEIDLDLQEKPSVKTLGIMWKSSEDIFTFGSTQESMNDLVFTKRTLLKKIATLYDPLGFITPFIISGKVIMQEIWTAGLDWDDPLPSSIERKARSWYEQVIDLASIRIPRCIQLQRKVVSKSLHVFTDASNDAYGASVYQRCTYDANDISCRLVIAKSKVAPLNAVSVPRLELLGAVLGLKLARKITKTFEEDIEDTLFWCDSMNVLWWIRGKSKNFKPFVANRIGEIQSKTNPQQWRYVPTKQNPADLLTRGSTISELSVNDQWWSGPEFLTRDEENWPENKIEIKLSNCSEMKKSYDADHTFSGVTVNEQNEWRLDPNRFSKWKRLLRVYSWTRRFIINCQSNVKVKFTGEISAGEIQTAEMKLLIRTQMEAFKDEYQCLVKNKPISNASKIVSLNPQIDEDGLIRAHGRLENANYLEYETRYPIILPRKHWVTKLIVIYHHEMKSHAAGINHILSELSVRFWILKGREVIREVQNECFECKRRKGKTARQIMAPLPGIRLKKPFQAFAKSGVDFAGPFITIQGRGKKRAKRYLCLFTCLLSRAVHLEMAYSLDTDSFLNAFYRMVNRRGVPEEVLSDNGSNFIGAYNEIKELVNQLDENKIQSSTSDKGIKWKFNAPYGPHLGGVFETMIKSAKRAIYNILGNADITDEELHTAFTGAEGLINSRPLTYQSADIRDETPITPNHFLFGRVGGNLVPEAVDTTSYNPKKRWRRVQELVHHTWRRWMKEWLPSLSPRKKWFRYQRDLQKGDVVLIISPDSQRGKWPIGRIIETFPGRDGHTRVAKIKVGSKEITRPITRLCPLECDAVNDNAVDERSCIKEGGNGQKN